MKKSILCVVILAVCIIGACSKEHVDPDPNNGNGGNNGNNPSPEPEIELRLSETHLFAGSDAMKKTVALIANADWSIDQNFTESEWAWCSVTPTYGSAGTTTLTVDIQANGYDKRIHDFLIRSGDTDISLTVEQKQVVYFILNGDQEKKFIFYDEGGQIELTGVSTVGCEIAYLDGTADWISEEKETRALESLNFRFRIAPYDGMESRRGRIVLKASGEDLADTVQIIQYHDKVIDIPDPYFRQYCIQNFDKNNDGQLTKREAFGITSIITSGEIESLQGIEAFENLYQLNVKAQITEVDLSHLSELSILDLTGNKLRSLDLRKNDKLIFVDCDDNQLETLLIGENNLASLSCSDNRLSSLTIGQGGDNSFTLNCDNNRLTSLSLTGCRWLNCDNNRLTSLDLNNSPMCTSLICSGNQLQLLDLSMLSKLDYVSCSNNRLEKLVLPNNSILTTLHASNNNLGAVDLHTSVYLTYLAISYNRLKTLSCNDITTLKTLYCNDNELETLDITGCVRLEQIQCSDNKLTDLDVSMTDLVSNTSIYPLCCSMQTLKTLRLKEGWQDKIKGINVDRSTYCIQETTQILYK